MTTSEYLRGEERPTLPSACAQLPHPRRDELRIRERR